MKMELGKSKYQNTEKVFYRRPHDTASAFAQHRWLTVYNRVTFTMCNPSRNLWSSNQNLLTVSRARIAFLVNGPSDTQLLPPGTVCLSTSGTSGVARGWVWGIQTPHWKMSKKFQKIKL